MDTGPKQRREMNPRFKANILSVLTFGWTLETFKLGYTRDIKDNDLYAPLPEHRSDVVGDAVQNAWDNEVVNAANHHRKPSLWRVLYKVFGTEFIMLGLIIAAMEFLIRLQQPIFLGLMLRYYSPIQVHNGTETHYTYLSRALFYNSSKSTVSWGETVFFAFGIIFCSAVNVMVQHPFMMAIMHLGMKMRVGMCSLIYRKALKVSLQDLSESSAGLVVNLMANDVNRFDTGPLFAHYLWIGPLETILMTIYLYSEMGLAAVTGCIVIMAVVPFQVFLGTRTAYYRKETALSSDERVKLMKEIIMGMEVIKMYTWEKPFRLIIDTVRRHEIHFIEMTSNIRGVIMSFIMFTSRFGIFITVLVYITLTGQISVENVFILTCYYNITKQTMTLYFPQAVGQIAETKVAVHRIRDYLLSEESQLPSRHKADVTELLNRPPKKRVIILDPNTNSQSGTPAPSTSKDKPKDNQNEKTNREEAIKFEDASSKWIKSADKDDVKNLDLTVRTGTLTTVIGSVGSGKSTLLHMVLHELPCSSGNLKVNGEVSYACQDPWLFVGSVRQNILFGQPFVKSRYMTVCKVCALERDISLFPRGDKTIVGERGVSLSGGQRARINLARAVYKEADIYLLDDPLSAVDTQVAKHIFEKCIKKYLGDKTVILVTHQIQFIKFVDNIVIMDKGRILAKGAFDDLDETQLKIIQLMKENVRKVNEDENESQTAQQLLSKVSSQRRHFSLLFDTSVIDQKLEEEAQTMGRVDGSVYKEYFRTGASCVFVCFVFFLFVLSQCCASATDYWISLWSRTEDTMTGDPTVDNILWSEQGLTRNTFVMVFGLLTIATVVFALIRAYSFFSLCMKSSIKFSI